MSSAAKSLATQEKCVQRRAVALRVDLRQTLIRVIIVHLRFAGGPVSLLVQRAVRVVIIVHRAVLRIGGGGQSLRGGVVVEVPSLGLHGAAYTALHAHGMNDGSATHRRQVIQRIVVVSRK